jgi:cobalt-zinc-cadmium efflux system protein
MGKHNESHHHEITNLSGKKMFWVTLLNATITITEVIGGFLSGSLALLSDAMHNLSDTLAMAMAYVANKIARRPNNEKQTYGYRRAEILSAFINAGVLLALSGVLIYEGINRFFNPEPINGMLLVIVAAIGLVANLLSVLFLKKDSKGSLNIKASYLHLLSDTISSIGVVLGGVAILIWGITWIDPIITILIALYIIREAWSVVKQTTNILMQASPNLDYQKIKADLEQIEHVNNVHHIHAWMGDEHTIYFEAHLDFDNLLLSEVDKICFEVECYLKNNYDIFHVTLQPEHGRDDNKSMICIKKIKENEKNGN